MKKITIIFAVMLSFTLFSLSIASMCLAQSDDKGRVTIHRVGTQDNDNKGRVETKIKVPNVVGKKYPEAKQILESSGFTVKATGQIFKASRTTVVKQSPAAGTLTIRGAVVTCNIQ